MITKGPLASGLTALTCLAPVQVPVNAAGTGAATVTMDNPEGAIDVVDPEGAVEVVLRRADAKIECKVTWPDEEAAEHDLESRSLHRAKHKVKAWLARDGFVPVDRWCPVGSDGNQIVRHFLRRPANYRPFPLTR
jgi:hypothetical protein